MLGDCTQTGKQQFQTRVQERFVLWKNVWRSK
jgi:hypothetical protein